MPHAKVNGYTPITQVLFLFHLASIAAGYFQFQCFYTKPIVVTPPQQSINLKQLMVCIMLRVSSNLQTIHGGNYAVCMRVILFKQFMVEIMRHVSSIRQTIDDGNYGACTFYSSNNLWWKLCCL